MSQDMPISLFRNVLELNFATCDMCNTPVCVSCTVIICLWCTHQPQWSVCMYDMCIFIMWYVVYGDIRIAHRYVMCASLWLQISWAGAHFTCLIMSIANDYEMLHIAFLVLFTWSYTCIPLKVSWWFSSTCSKTCFVRRKVKPFSKWVL